MADAANAVRLHRVFNAPAERVDHAILDWSSRRFRTAHSRAQQGDSER